MGTIIGHILRSVSHLLDKYVPGQGHRTILLAILTVVANVSLYLTGQTTPEAAGNNIVLALGLIFASQHKSEPPAG